MATPATGIQARSTLDELYRAHAAEIYRYVYAVLGNRADAEDVTQTTFMNALRALERGEVPRKPENWLVTIAHNLIRQRFRQQYVRPRLVELDDELPSLETDDSGPSVDDLVRALQRIPEAQREALVLRELEGRSYREMASILGVSRPALEGLIFRARRSLAEELENLVTCDRAEFALSRRADGRLGRKERRRLVAHLEECASCARVAAVAMKRRRAFKGLALLPLPWSLTLFKGAPSASAAVGLPAIGGAAGGGAAAAVGTGVAAKVAVGLAAVAVAGGAGYEGVKQVREPATPARPAKTQPAPPIIPAVSTPAVQLPTPVRAANERAVATAKPVARSSKPVAKKAKPERAKPERVRPVQAAAPPKGRSAIVRVKPVRTPTQTKSRGTTAPGRQTTKPAKKPRVTPVRGKSVSAAGQLRLKEKKPAPPR